MAGAPISWGICEVPGWGLQLPVERVLAEMHEVGLAATELGAAGWLEGDATQIAETLQRFQLAAVAAFVPLVLHDATQLDETLKQATAQAELLHALGATNFVTALVSDPDHWQRPPLGDVGWQQVYRGLEAVDEITGEFGLVQVVHPHVDTLVEQADEVRRVLDNTGVSFCLDTGHLMIGGADPAEMAVTSFDRVGLVHLKDVRRSVATRLQQGEFGLHDAVRHGIFPPLGHGDVALREVVTNLEARGYDGWYVFEQDAMLTDGAPPVGRGPIEDVRTSVAFLQALAA